MTPPNDIKRAAQGGKVMRPWTREDRARYDAASKAANEAAEAAVDGYTVRVVLYPKEIRE